MFNILNNRKVYGFIVFSILFSFLFSLIIMLNFSKPKDAVIKIISTGCKNNNSNSREIWIEKINVDGESINLNQISYDKNWSIKYGKLFSVNNEESEMTLNLKYKRYVTISFGSHQWSGIVKLDTNSKVKTLDLYSSVPSVKKVNIYNTSIDISDMNIIKNFIGVFLGILVSVILVLIFYMKYWSIGIEKNRLINLLFYSIPILSVFCVYLLAFYPGLMSPDSLDQWGQLTNFKFNDHHPVFHTFSEWCVTRFWYSPAAVAIFQIVFMALVFSYSMYSIESTYGNRKILLINTVVFSLFPINAMMNITLWKDIPYSISILLFTVLCFNLINKECWFIDKKFKIMLIISICLVVLFRQNGIVSIIGTLVIMLLFLDNKKQILKVYILSFIIIFVVKVPFYNIINAQPMQGWEIMSPVCHQIGAILQEDYKLNSDDKKILENVLPLQDWKNSYNPYNSDPIMFNKKINYVYLVNNKKNINSIYINLAKQKFSVIIKHLIKVNSISWDVLQPKNGYTGTVVREIVENNLGLHTKSKIISLQYFLNKLLDSTQSPSLNWLFWRPALSMYIIVSICFYFTFLKKDYRKCIIFSPIIFNTLGLILTIPVQDVRYLYSNFVVVFFIIPLFLCSFKYNEDNKEYFKKLL